MFFDLKVFLEKFQLNFGKVKKIHYVGTKASTFIVFNDEFRLDLEIYIDKFLIKNIEVKIKNQGLGSEIVNFLIEFSKKYEKTLIASTVDDSQDAIRFWKNSGFVPYKNLDYIFNR